MQPNWSTPSIGSLFSGIGGLELGCERAGWGTTAWQVEKDAYARKVLARHWPNARRYTDICDVKVEDLEHVNLIVGGFPCQDVSSAGKGAGLAGARSGLWREFKRIIEGVAPPYVIVENVASGARCWLPHVRRDLHLLGYRTRAVAISAFECGAPHLRKRVFVLAAVPPRIASYCDSQGQLQPQRVQQNIWRWARHGSGWTIEPPVSGVAHGIPNRVDRERCLGNAVVPRCAEVAARILRDWSDEA